MRLSLRLSGRQLVCGILMGAALLGSEHALAEKRGREHDTVRAAVENGEVRPLAEILAGIRGKLPGDIVGVEIERKDGRWLYEFRVVNSRGQLFDVYVDGRNGEIERIKEK